MSDKEVPGYMQGGQIEPSPTAETLIPSFLKDEINNNSASEAVPNKVKPAAKGKYFIEIFRKVGYYLSILPN